MRRPWALLGVVMLTGVIIGVLLIGVRLSVVDASRSNPLLEPTERTIPIYEDVYGKPIIEEVYDP
ncbi:hypothetical protein [Paenibacillus sp. B1-33]|uniref:hypothetical protein n=1 Tax=unclassified Paenibacillus TaxID=185978 RepID=UPI003D29F453